MASKSHAMQDLVERACSGQLTRRQFLQRAAILGVSATAAGSLLARSFCAYASLFWAIRLSLQPFLSAREFLTTWWLCAGYHLLTVFFMSFTLILGWSVIHVPEGNNLAEVYLAVEKGIAEAKANPDFLLTREIVEQWEAKHGRIAAHAWVLIRTDWSHRTDAKEFLNAGPDGSHTPGFHPQCVPFLAKERDILGVGVETVGTDAGQAYGFEPMFPCHTIMHGSNRFGLASLTNLDQLPPTGAVVVAPPLKIVNGSGSPLRVLALVPA